MKKYFLRLDDACPKRDRAKWDRMEFLLDKYDVKPLVGIIPRCKDPEFEKYATDENFWTNRVPAWRKKGWIFFKKGEQRI